jgi:hypothetical protein
MALLSPGVQVSITDESFSTGAGPGTVPLVFIATKQDKTTPDGTATAVGTTAANANNLYLISSQRELLQTFGNPDFNEVGGSAQNGYPLNEYGLLAAYSYLGVANRAYVIRADIDLNDLDPTTTEPTSDPADNLYWVDLNNFVPGIFQWNAAESLWQERVVTVVVNTDLTTWDKAANTTGFQVGDIIAVWYPTGVDTTNGLHLEYFALNGTADAWLKLDTTDIPNSTFWGEHYNIPSSPADNDYWIKTTTPNAGLSINVKQFDSALGQFVDLGSVGVYNNTQAYYTSAGVDANAVAAGTVVGIVDSSNTAVNVNTASADIVLQAHNGNTTVVGTATTSVQASGGAQPATELVDITVGATVIQVDLNTVDITAGDGAQVAALINASANAPGRLLASTNTAGDTIILTSLTGEDITVANATGAVNNPVSFFGFVDGDTFSNFAAITYEASLTQPSGTAAYGTYWYDPSFTVDLMEKGTTTWVEIDPATVYVQSDAPASPSAGDLWVETDSGTAYPVIYRRNTGNTAWVQLDNTDQTTASGVVFADARASENVPAVPVGAADASNTLDTDAPDPAIYPVGMLLWNSRASGRNVKVWTQDATALSTAPTVLLDRWVSASGNANDGSLITGAAAQKQVVIEALASTLTANEDVRNDTIFYNLIAAPGFPELMDEMLSLNVDRKEQAFVIGDTPFSLSSDTTSLQEWATNTNNAAGNGDDGLVSADPYLGVYYPSGLATNVDGSEVVVPASHMVLRQLAYNDQVAYPWFAPAGFARGTISNATAVGYLDSEDEFVTVTLNEGQRDTLYNNNVNPIATLPGRGIVIWGQKTRNATAGALDRVNVARLVNYIRYQADVLAQPFLFEPNDRVTRDAVKEAFDSFLAELVTLRGVTDFLVVVDESNNTPARIDRNELWVDIAIQPTKAVEFIYIPIRLRNTGADLQPGA